MFLHTLRNILPYTAFNRYMFKSEKNLYWEVKVTDSVLLFFIKSDEKVAIKQFLRNLTLPSESL